MRETSPFCDLLRRYRIETGLSQERLAELAGLSTRGISDLERGVRTAPRFETVHLLADGLGLTTEQRGLLLRAARPAERASVPPDGAPGIARLPIPPTPLVGRERESSLVAAMLDEPGDRLITLTGPGGVGKTRLAIELAGLVAGRFSHGVRLVDLAPLADAALVVGAVADAVGAREGPRLPLEAAVARAIGERRLLLLLDNFEHVLPAATLVAGLLARCPGLTVLVTSRVPLDLRGERQVPVPPLEVPDAQSAAPAANIIDAEAVRLFVARARDVRPDFTVRDQDAPVVAEICRRLDGLPLALELAAVRTRALPPMALLSRLDQRLPLLRDGPVDMPARHRTLRATIAWSHDLLDPEERRLFRRLAIFAGGWTLEAAGPVAGDGSDAFEALDSLVTKSLVVLAEGPGGQPRYTMLETVREFAMEELQASGEVDATGRRHADWYLRLAQASAANLADAGGDAWLTALVTEQANLRAALAWLRDRGQMREGLRLAAALGGFWRLRSTPTEGRRWLEVFLTSEARASVADAEWVAALQWAGELAGLEGDMATAEQRLAESLATARRVGDRPGVIAALAAIGSMAVQRGDIATSLPVFEEAATLARELGAHRQAAFLTAYLAFAEMHRGHLDRADSLLTESGALLHKLGDVRSFEAAFTALMEGWVEVVREDHERASQVFERCVELSRALDSKAILSAALAGIGEGDLAQGRTDVADARFREGLIMGHEGGFLPGVAFSLQGLVRVAADRGDLGRAVRLAAALEAFPGSIGGMPPGVRARYQAAVARARRSLDAATVDAETARGRRMDPGSIIAELP